MRKKRDLLWPGMAGFFLAFIASFSVTVFHSVITEWVLRVTRGINNPTVAEFYSVDYYVWGGGLACTIATMLIGTWWFVKPLK